MSEPSSSIAKHAVMDNYETNGQLCYLGSAKYPQITWWGILNSSCIKAYLLKLLGGVSNSAICLSLKSLCNCPFLGVIAYCNFSGSLASLKDGRSFLQIPVHYCTSTSTPQTQTDSQQSQFVQPYSKPAL